jgi:hypothetical protein
MNSRRWHNAAVVVVYEERWHNGVSSVEQGVTNKQTETETMHLKIDGK